MTAQLRDVIKWLNDTIMGDTDVTDLGVSGVFFYNAPENQPYPYIILQKTAESHTFDFGVEAFNRHWLAVKCLDLGFDGGDRARQVMDKIRPMIGEARPTISSGTTMLIRAQSGFELSEAELGNNNFYHVGTVYVVWLAD